MHTPPPPPPCLRRVTMDVGTRSYIENVLQTKVKNSSADRNWRKLRTGMFVVRTLGREVILIWMCHVGVVPYFIFFRVPLCP